MDVRPVEELTCPASISLIAQWKTNRYDLSMFLHSSLGEVKECLEIRTNVPTEHQKLVGLKPIVPGTKLTDATLMSELQLKLPHKFMMIGNPMAEVIVDPLEIDMPDVLDDLDWDEDLTEEDMMILPVNDVVSKQKLAKAIETTKFNIINEKRPNKGLLVMDLDYCIFDMKSSATNFLDLKRPYTDAFLAACYPYYDIIFWSQTSWKWLEIKLTELGVLTHPNYKIMCVLDKSSMFSVTSRKNGTSKKHQVKALDVIWAHFKGIYDSHNSIHIDDLARNFAMNRQSGLKISPYKNAAQAMYTDTELLHLAKYLVLIGKTVKDFNSLHHGQWKTYIEKYGHKLDEKK